MRKAARAVIVHNQHLLLMRRNKFGAVYYVLLGGAIEPGEQADQTVIREVQEEASITVANPRLVYIEEAGDPYGTQYIFLCDYTGGEAKMSANAVEASLNAMGKNLFEPLWVPVSKLSTLPFRSTVLRDELLTALRDGFPDTPKILTSQAEISYTNAESSEQEE